MPARLQTHPFFRRTLLALALAGSAFVGCADMLGDVAVDPMDDGGRGVDSLNQTQTACEPGDVRCQGAVLQACEVDGSGWAARELCASPVLCGADPGEPARCLAPVCTPGITCDAARLRQCNPTGTGFDTLGTCASPAHCDAARGACLDAPCTPGELGCNGEVLQRCNDESSGHDLLASCATPALCERLLADSCGDAPESCVLTQAICPEPSCAAGELRCSGARLETCNAGRSGWDLVEECVTEGVCELTRRDPVAFACAQPACEPGDVMCSPDGERLACNADRTEYSDAVGQCRSAETCAPEGCLADTACLPGTLSCNGNTLLQCQLAAGARPTRVTVDTCATRALCLLSAGTTRGAALLVPACAEPACAPGEHRCQGAQMQVCNAQRSGFEDAESCASAALCEAGAGTGVCPAPCSGAACNGSVLRLCNDDLTGLIDAQDCGSPGSCDSARGSCTGVCTPGALRCNGAGLERCQAGDVGWQRLATCDSPGLCQASAARGLAACGAPVCTPGQRRCTGPQLETCNLDQTGFVVERTCRIGQLCDAAAGQCDNCVAGSAACVGDVFTRCSDNGQLATIQACTAGSCAAFGDNLGCLSCATPNGYRCDGASLMLCSADQRRETQVTACGSPEACRADLGRCAGCSPAGSSRCDGDRVLTCLADGTEVASETCGAGACEEVGDAASCALRCEAGDFQCSPQGELLVCSATTAAFVSQAQRVFCGSFAACDAEAGACSVCSVSDQRCSGNDVQACALDRSGFETIQSCGPGLTCVQSGTSDARCACAEGSSAFCEDGRLLRCDPLTQDVVTLESDAVCEGSVRVSCSAAGAVRTACASAQHCAAGTSNRCAACLTDADCPSDGLACNGPESCRAGVCEPSGLNPCAPGLGTCVETASGFECQGDPLIDIDLDLLPI